MVLLASSVCPLADEAEACVSFLMGGTGGRKNWVLLWWVLLNKILTQLSADGCGCVPFLLVV